MGIQSVTPRCTHCGYDQSGEVQTWREQCPLGGRCVECGQAFDWGEAFRVRNAYFDDLPRTGLLEGFARSLGSAMFPWASRHVSSSPRVHLGRALAVSMVAALLWHLVASGWIVAVDLGGVPGFRILSRGYASSWIVWPWGVHWGYVTSSGVGGSFTAQTLGNGMTEPLVVCAGIWLLGLFVMAVLLLVRRRPHGVRGWLRVLVRSAPGVFGSTLVLTGLWAIGVVSGVLSRAEDSTVLTIGLLALQFGVPMLLFGTLWWRHVRDAGVTSRPVAAASAMTLTPLALLIAFVAWNLARNSG